MRRQKDLPARVLGRITRHFDGLPIRVHGPHALLLEIAGNRDAWGTRLSRSAVLARLVSRGLFREALLKAEAGYPDVTRFIWRSATDAETALSLRKHAYFSHGTALAFHGLREQPPQTYYVNAEQSPKPTPEAELTQSALDRAFRSKQRQSKLAYAHGASRIVVVSGKNTGRLGVSSMEVDGRPLDITSLERTLVDIAVRPAYGGGIDAVLDTYRSALPRISVAKVIDILDELDYVYPYHQSIGFCLEQAGATADQLHPLQSRDMPFKFYLTHGMKNPAFDRPWRLFIPKAA